MNHDADLFETHFRTKLFPRINGGLCYDSIPRNSRDKLTFYGIKKKAKTERFQTHFMVRGSDQKPRHFSIFLVGFRKVDCTRLYTKPSAKTYLY